MIGWVAGGGSPPDSGAVILFGILFLWQMPHFWALALRYRADYAAGGFPMVAEAVGVEGTARLILALRLRPHRAVARRAHLRAGRPGRPWPRPRCWAGASSGSPPSSRATPRTDAVGCRSSSSRTSISSLLFLVLVGERPRAISPSARGARSLLF